jgi:hypothetical protein
MGSVETADMLARGVEERLRERAVYRKSLADGLERLGDSLSGRDRELAWRLQDRARHILGRL